MFYLLRTCFRIIVFFHEQIDEEPDTVPSSREAQNPTKNDTTAAAPYGHSNVKGELFRNSIGFKSSDNDTEKNEKDATDGK